MIIHTEKLHFYENLTLQQILNPDKVLLWYARTCPFFLIRKDRDVDDIVWAALYWRPKSTEADKYYTINEVIQCL